MQAVILAGGLGTRMRPFTAYAPKCMFPIRGKPFIDYQLKLLEAGGVRRVVLCLGFLGEKVRIYLGDHYSHGLEIEYSWDRADMKGTASALKNSESLLEEKFFLTWGDSYVRVNHREMMAAHHAGTPGLAATMGVFRNDNCYDSSNVRTEGNRVVRYEKGVADSQQLTEIDVGISVFERSALSTIPPARNLGLEPLFSAWAASGRLASFPVTKRFYEVGSWTGVADFNKFVEEGGVEL